MRSRVVVVCLGVVLAAPVPAGASGESVLVSPGSGSAGTVVRLTYSMNGGCGQREVAEFFFDANPVGRAAVDQQTCHAVLRYAVPATACTSHQVSAAWHYPGSEQLYGLASSRFTVTRRGSTCPVPPSTRPSPTRLSPRPVPAATSARPATRPPAPRPVVPVVTSPPPAVAAVSPEADRGGGGVPAAVWVLLGLGSLGGLALLARRWGARSG